MGSLEIRIKFKNKKWKYWKNGNYLLPTIIRSGGKISAQEWNIIYKIIFYTTLNTNLNTNIYETIKWSNFTSNKTQYNNN